MSVCLRPLLHADSSGLCSFARTIPSSPRVVCGLGVEHMPTACALYPLGEVWNPPAPSLSFYSLDSEERCEGTLEPVVTSTRQYSDRNNLAYRRSQWEWFQRLATGFACETFPSHFRSLLHSLGAHDVGMGEGVDDVAQSLDQLLMDAVFSAWYGRASSSAAGVSSPGVIGAWESCRHQIDSDTARLRQNIRSALEPAGNATHECLALVRVLQQAHVESTLRAKRLQDYFTATTQTDP